jgi:hypothetical protein
MMSVLAIVSLKQNSRESFDKKPLSLRRLFFRIAIKVKPPLFVIPASIHFWQLRPIRHTPLRKTLAPHPITGFSRLPLHTNRCPRFSINLIHHCHQTFGPSFASRGTPMGIE